VAPALAEIVAVHFELEREIEISKINEIKGSQKNKKN
jgi:hypothetical protein